MFEKHCGHETNDALLTCSVCACVLVTVKKLAPRKIAGPAIPKS